MRRALFAVILVACTGGPGELPNGSSGGGSSGATSSSSSTSSSSTSSTSGSTANTIIHASDYNQSCTTQSDCVSVREGSVCGCGCPSAAINKSDQTQYAADTGSLKAGCPSPDTSACGVDCAATTAVCTNQTCRLTTGVVIVDAGRD